MLVDVVSFQRLVESLAQRIKGKKYKYVYGVPRNGWYVATALAEITKLKNVSFIDVDWKEEHVLVVDDLIDSGKTRNDYQDYDFEVLIDKRLLKKQEWIKFFWEQGNIEDNVQRILQFIGEDVNREGLKRTPERFTKAISYLTSGYNKDIKSLFTNFTEKYDEMIVVKDIDFFSLCEHHLLCFWGKVHIAYLSNGKVVGLSKLARVVDAFARRLQVQERLTNQIAQAIMDNLKCRGVGVVLEAQHLCMLSRGVEKQNSKTITSSLLGEFRKQEVRAEFLNLIKS